MNQPIQLSYEVISEFKEDFVAKKELILEQLSEIQTIGVSKDDVLDEMAEKKNYLADTFIEVLDELEKLIQQLDAYDNNMQDIDSNHFEGMELT